MMREFPVRIQSQESPFKVSAKRQQRLSERDRFRNVSLEPFYSLGTMEIKASRSFETRLMEEKAPSSVKKRGTQRER